MAIHPLSRSLLPLSHSTMPPFPFSLKQLFATASESYCNLLQKTTMETNLERILNQSKQKLDASVIENILQEPSIDRSVALRFFIWAGQQSNYRHSRLMYNKACDFLRISRHPETLNDALEVYKRDGSLVSVKTFKVIFNLCKEAKLAEVALVLMRKMGEFNCRPDTTTYNVVIRLFVGKNEMGVAEKLMGEMGLIGLHPDMITYVAMIKGFCNVGYFDGARKLCDEMRSKGCSPNVVVYSMLLEALCKAGRTDVGIELLGEMERSTGGRDCAPNVVTYTTLIHSLCENGRVMEAVGVLDRMAKQGCTPNRVTVSTILDGLCREGCLDDAYKVIDRIIKEGSLSSSQCYSSLTVSLLRIKNVGEAEKLVRRVLSGGIRLDGLAFSSLVKEVCLDGRSMDGFGWYCEAEKDALSAVDSDVYPILLKALCKQDHFVEAANVTGRMVERGIQLRTPHVNSIVEQLKNAGKNELALRLTSIGR